MKWTLLPWGLRRSINMHKKYLNFRQAALFLSGALIVLVFTGVAVLSVGCSTKNEPIAVLSRYGLKGINPAWVVHSHSCPAVNTDYKNKIYFVILRAQPSALSDFIAVNNFKKQSVQTV